MLYVYILFSESKNRYYVGQTNNISNRLERHNSGTQLATKFGVPWKIIIYFELETRSDAIVLEQKIKKRGAKGFTCNRAIIQYHGVILLTLLNTIPIFN